MLQALRRRMEDDKGFTLIELMVVVLIIAILLAVAIPTFLRVRRNAQDRAAQNSAAAALKAEKAFYTETASSQQYTADGVELEDIEASIDYFGVAAGASCAGYADGPKCVNVNLISADEVMLTALSESGTYWAVRDKAVQPGAGTFYNAGGDAAVPLPAGVTDDEW